MAELLGTTPEIFQAMLRREGGPRRNDRVPWAEAAAYLLDAWSQADILAQLGPATRT